MKGLVVLLCLTVFVLVLTSTSEGQEQKGNQTGLGQNQNQTYYNLTQNGRGVSNYTGNAEEFIDTFTLLLTKYKWTFKDFQEFMDTISLLQLANWTTEKFEAFNGKKSTFNLATWTEVNFQELGAIFSSLDELSRISDQKTTTKVSKVSRPSYSEFANWTTKRLQKFTTPNLTNWTTVNFQDLNGTIIPPNLSSENAIGIRRLKLVLQFVQAMNILKLINWTTEGLQAFMDRKSRYLTSSSEPTTYIQAFNDTVKLLNLANWTTKNFQEIRHIGVIYYPNEETPRLKTYLRRLDGSVTLLNLLEWVKEHVQPLDGKTTILNVANSTATKGNFQGFIGNHSLFNITNGIIVNFQNRNDNVSTAQGPNFPVVNVN